MLASRYTEHFVTLETLPQTRQESAIKRTALTVKRYASFVAGFQHQLYDNQMI